MSSISRYRAPSEGYPIHAIGSAPPNASDRSPQSPSKRRELLQVIPSPAARTRTSPARPQSRRSAPSPSQPSPQRSIRQSKPSQWFFTADEVASPPSLLDGLPLEEERLRRAKGISFIYQAGVMLRLPQVTQWVAGVFFHRFYMRLSMLEDKGGIHHYNTAATSLFLANKTEENCLKTKDIIIAVAKVAQKNSKLIIDEQSKEYWRWRDSILTYEELMLETLTFDLMVQNPYDPLFKILHDLGIQHNRRLRDSAWTFCNDSALSMLPLLMSGRDIAVAALFFATSVTEEKIADLQGEPWWKALSGDEEGMVQAVELMCGFYKENPLRKVDNKYPASPVFNLENTRRRGELPSQLRCGSSDGGTPRFDRGTRSPLGRVNGQGRQESEDVDQKREVGKEASQEKDVDLASQPSRGDSDVGLKAAANNPNVNDGKPNGGRMPSPGMKRKSAEPEPVAEGEGEGEGEAGNEDTDERPAPKRTKLDVEKESK